MPCTTPLERNDLAISPRDPFVVYMSKVAEPAGESRSDHEMLAGIACRMGVSEAFTEGRDEADWLRWIYDLTRQQAAQHALELPPLEDLKRDGWYEAPTPAEPTVMLSAFRRDPATSPLKTPSGKIEIFSEVVAGFGLR